MGGSSDAQRAGGKDFGNESSHAQRSTNAYTHHRPTRPLQRFKQLLHCMQHVQGHADSFTLPLVPSTLDPTAPTASQSSHPDMSNSVPSESMSP